MKILELWKDIKDFEGIYKISNIGRIISVERYDTLGRRVKAKMLKVRDDGRGYNQVDLSKEAIRYTYKVHNICQSKLHCLARFFQMVHLYLMERRKLNILAQVTT